MRRDTKAFLIDVVEAADAILEAVNGIDLDDYCNSRLIRSSVEREFILIGEALNNLSRLNCELFARIENAPRIISFRNKLTHEYVKVDNNLVWGVIHSYLQPLRSACMALVSESGRQHFGS
jgi:uncharacterized protein with HEPN domain